MSALALRDHSREILLASAGDMALGHADKERANPAQDIVPTKASTTSAAAEPGALRQTAGFDFVQLFAGLWAMQASVMALWQRTEGAESRPSVIEDIVRFNEGMDRALAPSVQRYSGEVATSRDMNRLISDLLEYTRARLGAGMPTDRIACDLGPVAEA